MAVNPILYSDQVEITDSQNTDIISIERSGVFNYQTKENFLKPIDVRLDTTQLTVARHDQALNVLEKTVQGGQGATIDYTGVPPITTDGRSTGRMNTMVNGLTLTNLMKNGDFSNGPTGWQGLASVLSISSYGLVATGNGTDRTVQANTLYMKDYNIISGDKIFFYYRVRAKGEAVESLLTRVIGLASATYTASSKYSPVQNEWYDLSFYNTASVTGGGFYVSLQAVYSDASSANGKAHEIEKGLWYVNLTQTFGAGNEPSEAQIRDIVQKYFSGTQSLQLPARLKKVGKNLFDKSKVVLNSYYDSFGNTTALVLATRGTEYIAVKPSSQYKSSHTVNISEYDKDFVHIKRNADTSLVSTTSETRFLRIASSNAGINLSTLNIMLNLGSTALPYEPYDSQALVIQDTAELHSVPAIADQVLVLDGEWWRRQNVSEPYVLQSGDITGYVVTGVNTDYAVVTLPANATTSTYHENGGRAYLPTYPLGAATDEIANIGKWYTYDSASRRIRIYFSKGAYANLDAAKADLDGTVIYYQLATPVLTELHTIGNLTATPSCTISWEGWTEDSYQTDTSSQITLPHTGAVQKVFGYDDHFVEYEVPSTGYTQVGTLLTITGAEENEVWYVQQVKDTVLYPQMTVNTLNNLVVPKTISTATYTVLDGDHTLLVSRTTAGACAITIPSALIAKYIKLVIKDSGGLANTNNITISTEGAEKIDGADTYVINTAKGKVELSSDGSNLWVVG